VFLEDDSCNTASVAAVTGVLENPVSAIAALVKANTATEMAMVRRSMTFIFISITPHQRLTLRNKRFISLLWRDFHQFNIQVRRKRGILPGWPIKLRADSQINHHPHRRSGNVFGN